MNDGGAGTGTADRLIFAILGVGLVVVGAYGLARGLGGLGGLSRSDVLLDPDLRAQAVQYAGWVGGIATFVALLVAWVGWRWLRRQLAPVGSTGTVTLETGRTGRTAVDPAAVADALRRDLMSSDQVVGGRARIVTREGAPALALRVEVAVGADPLAVRSHVADHVLPRARTALGRPDLAAHLRLLLADPAHRSLE